jgi:hypothetical protein
MLQAGRSLVRFPAEVDFFNLPNPSSRAMALGSTQPLTQMSSRNLPGGKKRPTRRADNLAEYLKMWEPQTLAILRASTACTGIALPYLPLLCYTSNISTSKNHLSGRFLKIPGEPYGHYIVR